MFPYPSEMQPVQLRSSVQTDTCISHPPLLQHRALPGFRLPRVPGLFLLPISGRSHRKMPVQNLRRHNTPRPLQIHFSSVPDIPHRNRHGMPAAFRHRSFLPGRRNFGFHMSFLLPHPHSHPDHTMRPARCSAGRIHPSVRAGFRRGNRGRFHPQLPTSMSSQRCRRLPQISGFFPQFRPETDTASVQRQSGSRKDSPPYRGNPHSHPVSEDRHIPSSRYSCIAVPYSVVPAHPPWPSDFRSHAKLQPVPSSCFPQSAPDPKAPRPSLSPHGTRAYPFRRSGQ